ncbi:nucleoside 2-deoxyribosyltransferase [Paucilactobacillus kaifaensis]|uniref:nucleoside 2-deoxyribosyltransferase n=1 Tax=Paucilactobacillus kaifaensis TaxID=2559921 RepID=UPI0010FA47CD|nr:nucleoside 2-deoxyribosyltransferase [Paucilactobacillus kaifaensis]
MKKIYLAGPFFSESQIKRITKVEKALAANPTTGEIFSPRLSDENDDSINAGSPAWAKSIFNKDVAEIDNADIIVAITDFAYENVDSGTAFEIGYAYKLKKPIILLQEKDEPLNLMVSQAGHYYTKSIDDLASYDFNALPAKEYTGKAF